MKSKNIAWCLALACGLMLFMIALQSGTFDWQTPLLQPAITDLILVKLFGPFVGRRLIILLLGMAGFLSCYYWFKTQWNEQVALIGATAWVLHAGVLWRVLTGQPILLWILLLPLFLWLVQQIILKTSVRHTIGLAVLTGVMLLGQGEYAMGRIILPAMLIWAIVLLVRHYSKIAKRKLIACGLVWLVISAVITAPHWASWISPENPNLWIDDGTISVQTAVTNLWYRANDAQDLPVTGNFAQSVYGNWEVNVALGVLASCLAVLGLAIGWKKKFGQQDYYYYAWALIVLGLTLASNLKLWTTVDQFFNRGLDVAPRLLELSSFGLVIAVACGANGLLTWIKKYQWPVTLVAVGGIMLSAGLWVYQVYPDELWPLTQVQAASNAVLINLQWMPQRWLTITHLASLMTVIASGVWLYRSNSARLQHWIDHRRIKPARPTFNSDRVQIITVLLLCSGVIGIQLMLLPNFGTLDTSSFVEVVEALDGRGLLAGYSYKNLYYPPLASVFLYPLTWFPIQVFTVKFLIAIFFYASVLMILYYSRVVKQHSWLHSLRTSLIILSNVALIESVFILGYLDILLIPALLLTFYCMDRKYYLWAGVGLAIAFMTKLLPILLLPAFFVWFYHRQPVRRIEWKSLLRFCLGLAIVVVPQLMLFDQVALLNVLVISNAHGDMLSHAYNFNQIVALLTDQHTASIQIYYIGRAIFGLTVVFLLRALILSRQSFVQLCYTCTGIFLAYFVWFSGVHENHLFPALIPLMVLVVMQPNARHWLWYHAITLLIFFNLFIPYGFGLYEQYHGLVHFWTLNASQIRIITIVLSLLSVAAYVAFMRQTVRRDTEEHHA